MNVINSWSRVIAPPAILLLISVGPTYLVSLTHQIYFKLHDMNKVSIFCNKLIFLFSSFTYVSRRHQMLYVLYGLLDLSIYHSKLKNFPGSFQNIHTYILHSENSKFLILE